MSKVVAGVNDLLTVCPELAAEWNVDKNGELKPTMIAAGAPTKVWWICQLGHEWQATVFSRSNGCGCPYCAGRKAWPGFNDLMTVRPELAAEWNTEKNGILKPTMVSRGSAKKVWWKCPVGHEWKAVIYNRSNGSGCPYCAGRKVWPGFNDLLTACPELAAEWNFDKNREQKPMMFTKGSPKKVWWICQCGHEWQASINNRVKGSGCPQCDMGKTSYAEQAILYYMRKLYPNTVHRYTGLGFELDVYIPDLNLAIEYDGRLWHKNQTKDERKFRKCQERGIALLRVREPGLCDAWFCDAAFVRKNTSDDRSLTDVIREVFLYLGLTADIDTARDHRDIQREYLVNRQKDSFAVLYPDIADQWNYEKNAGLRPEMFSAHANDKIWWRCRYGHEWKAAIYERSSGCGCPYCAGRKAWPGFNDLMTVRPELAAEWNFDKNGGLKPTMLTKGSNKKVWWKCSRGHEWMASPNKRNGRTECPACRRINRIETGKRHKRLSKYYKYFMRRRRKT